MKTSRFNSASPANAFTLVELMVSMTVLILMVASLSQMMTGALKATSGSFQHMDADTQARMVLDRMAFDISKMVKRPDVDYYFSKNTTAGGIPGNDQMAFYSESGGYYPTGSTATQKSNVALVGYRINTSNQLERMSKGLVWNGVSVSGYNPMVFLPQTLLNTWPAITTAAAGGDDYQVVGDQVFRMEICYLVHNTTSATVAQLSDTPNLEGVSSGNVGYFNPQEVVAVVVTIAVLNTNNGLTVTPAQLQAAAAQLPDISGTGTSLGSISTTAVPSTVVGPAAVAWRTALNAPYTLGTALGLPKVAASQVRVYQRYCYLTPEQ